MSDHYPVCLTRNTKNLPKKATHTVIEYRDYKHFDEVNFLQNSSSVTLVHSIKKQFNHQEISWMANENWMVLEFTQMTGSETEVLVAFIEDTYANMEVFSRARKKLIIVTK